MIRMLQYCVLVPLFFFHVSIRMFKNFVSFWGVVSIISLWCLNWPSPSIDSPWYVFCPYSILGWNILCGTILTLIDLPGFILAFIHILISAGTITDFKCSDEFERAFSRR